jgi:hypothetical protein
MRNDPNKKPAANAQGCLSSVRPKLERYAALAVRNPIRSRMITSRPAHTIPGAKIPRMETTEILIGRTSGFIGKPPKSLLKNSETGCP